MAHEIKVKRVYEPPDPSDGFRILVDRLWPRGLKKEQVQADLWLKEAAPSNELRTWFHHEAPNWEEFQDRYTAEMDSQSAAVARLLELLGQGPITLLFSARDPEHNQAVVLRTYLLQQAQAGSK